MSYPTYTQLQGSKVVGDDGIVVDRAESGKPRFRTMYTSTQREIFLTHEEYSTNKDALFTHYDSNKTASFTVTWQGDTPTKDYTCRYAARPLSIPVGAGLYRITVHLIVV